MLLQEKVLEKDLETDLDDNEIEIEVQDSSSGIQSFEIPGMPGGNVGMVNLGDILGKSMGGKKGKKKKCQLRDPTEF